MWERSFRWKSSSNSSLPRSDLVQSWMHNNHMLCGNNKYNHSIHWATQMMKWKKCSRLTSNIFQLLEIWKKVKHRKREENRKWRGKMLLHFVKKVHFNISWHRPKNAAYTDTRRKWIWRSVISVSSVGFGAFFAEYHTHTRALTKWIVWLKSCFPESLFLIFTCAFNQPLHDDFFVSILYSLLSSSFEFNFFHL